MAMCGYACIAKVWRRATRHHVVVTHESNRNVVQRAQPARALHKGLLDGVVRSDYTQPVVVAVAQTDVRQEIVVALCVHTNRLCRSLWLAAEH